MNKKITSSVLVCSFVSSLVGSTSTSATNDLLESCTKPGKDKDQVKAETRTAEKDALLAAQQVQYLSFIIRNINLFSSSLKELVKKDKNEKIGIIKKSKENISAKKAISALAIGSAVPAVALLAQKKGFFIENHKSEKQQIESGEEVTNKDAETEKSKTEVQELEKNAKTEKSKTEVQELEKNAETEKSKTEVQELKKNVENEQELERKNEIFDNVFSVISSIVLFIVSYSKVLLSVCFKAIGAVMNNVVLPIFSGVLSALAVPILILIIVYIFYYNYFVLHSGVLQRILNAISGVIGSCSSFISKCISNLFFKNANGKNKKVPEKVLEKVPEKVPELIAVNDLEDEISNIQKNFANKQVGEIKNKINELKNRIYATRGLFSDRKVRNFGSWTNALKYYVTTGLIFTNTRLRYNKCEKILGELESSIETITKIVDFSNELKKDYKNASPAIDDLLSAKENNLCARFIENLSSLRKLKVQQNLENFVVRLENELCDYYIFLIKKVTKEKIKNTNFDAKELESIKTKIATHTNHTEFFSENYKLSINAMTNNIEKLIDLKESNNKASEILKFLGEDNYSINETVKEVGSLLEADSNLFSFFSNPSKENVFIKKDILELLDEIYENYDKLEKFYIENKDKNTDSVKDYDVTVKFNEYKRILEKICGKDSNIKKAKEGYLKIISKIKENNEGVNLKDSDTIYEYTDRILSNIMGLIRLTPEKKDTNINKVLNKRINRYIKKAGFAQLGVITTILKNLKNASKAWKDNVNIGPYIEKITSGTSDADLKEFANECCAGDDVSTIITSLPSNNYKKNLVTLFNKEKEKRIAEVTGKLKKVREEVRSKEEVINSIKEKLATIIKEAENFLNSPNVNAGAKELFEKFSSILREIGSHTEGKNITNIGKKLFYPDDYDEAKVVSLIGFLNKYKEADSFAQQSNVFEFLKYFFNLINKKEEGDYYEKYLEYCLNLIKEKVKPHIEGKEKKISLKSLGNLSKELVALKKVLPDNLKKVLDESIEKVNSKMGSLLTDEINSIIDVDNEGMAVIKGEIKLSEKFDNDVEAKLSSALRNISSAEQCLKNCASSNNDGDKAYYVFDAFRKITEAKNVLEVLKNSKKLGEILLDKVIDKKTSSIGEVLKELDSSSILRMFFYEFVKSKDHAELCGLFGNFCLKFIKNGDIKQFVLCINNSSDILKLIMFGNEINFGNNSNTISAFVKTFPAPVAKVFCNFLFETVIKNKLIKYVNLEESETDIKGKLMKFIGFKESIQDKNYVFLLYFKEVFELLCKVGEKNSEVDGYKELFSKVTEAIVGIQEGIQKNVSVKTVACNCFTYLIGLVKKEEIKGLESFVYEKVLYDFIMFALSLGVSEDTFKEVADSFKTNKTYEKLSEHIKIKLYSIMPSLDPDYKSTVDKVSKAILGLLPKFSI